MRLRGGLIDSAPEPSRPLPERAGGAADGRVLVGGVGYRFHRDGSFGLLAGDALARLAWPDHVEVEDLGYGAILVAHDLSAASPPYDRLVLLSATVRDREPGRLYPRAWRGGGISPEEVQARVREAGGGVIDVDHLLVIADALDALPRDVRVLELEPVEVGGGEGLSEAAEARLSEAIAWARREALAPLASEPRTAAPGEIGEDVKPASPHVEGSGP